MRVPNFFIVGMPRSGTTSLYTYLKQHRHIFLSIYKEPLFFCKDLDHRPYSVTSEAVYRSLFDGADDYPVVGEGSVWYLTSETAAREIAEASPGARIVVMLRDPVHMMRSLHSLYVRTGNEDIEDFAAALEAQEDRRAGQRIPAGNYFANGLLYSDVAHYYPKLKRFYDVFGKERIHVIKFEHFAADPLSECRKVFRFLEVDAEARVELDLGAAKRIIRPRAMEQIRRAHPEVKAKLSRKMGKTHLGAKRKPLGKNLERTLRRVFRQDLERTGQLTGLDLSAWSTVADERD